MFMNHSTAEPGSTAEQLKNDGPSHAGACVSDTNGNIQLSITHAWGSLQHGAQFFKNLNNEVLLWIILLTYS